MVADLLINQAVDSAWHCCTSTSKGWKPFPEGSILLQHHWNKTNPKLVLKEALFLNKLRYSSIKMGTKYHLPEIRRKVMAFALLAMWLANSLNPWVWQNCPMPRWHPDTQLGKNSPNWKDPLRRGTRLKEQRELTNRHSDEEERVSFPFTLNWPIPFVTLLPQGQSVLRKNSFLWRRKSCFSLVKPQTVRVLYCLVSCVIWWLTMSALLFLVLTTSDLTHWSLFHKFVIFPWILVRRLLLHPQATRARWRCFLFMEKKKSPY